MNCEEIKIDSQEEVEVGVTPTVLFKSEIILPGIEEYTMSVLELKNFEDETTIFILSTLLSFWANDGIVGFAVNPSVLDKEI